MQQNIQLAMSHLSHAEEQISLAKTDFSVPTFLCGKLDEIGRRIAGLHGRLDDIQDFLAIYGGNR